MINELKILLEMQKRDDTIGEKELLTKMLPEQLNSLRTNLRNAEEELTLVKHNLEENLKNQKMKELLIKENTDKINKYKNQLLSIKTNKEYKALNSEISHLENRNSDIDDEIIVLMEEEVILRDELAAAQKEQSRTEQELRNNEEKLKNKIEQVKEEIVSIRNERNKLAEKIPINLLNRYAALIKNKGRKAVVFNLNNACSGCGFNIRPQLVIEINEGVNIVSCENCGRIIVNKPQDEN
ncbi:MAG: hypothetical protein JXB60_03850 [Candidatus Cloacimonetes bacterium]|nr:hypothetical protein [Candidatus Cloacimonadota bacterium]